MFLSLDLDNCRFCRGLTKLYNIEPDLTQRIGLVHLFNTVDLQELKIICMRMVFYNLG